jgi:hypothetical protein
MKIYWEIESIPVDERGGEGSHVLVETGDTLHLVDEGDEGAHRCGDAQRSLVQGAVFITLGLGQPGPPILGHRMVRAYLITPL